VVAGAMVEVQVVEEPAVRVVYLRRVLPDAEVGAFLVHAAEVVASATAVAGGTRTGPSFAWYHPTTPGLVDVAVGFPGAGPLRSLGADVEVLQRPGGTAAVAERADVDAPVAHTVRALVAWLAERGASPRGDRWVEAETGRVVVPVSGAVLDLTRLPTEVDVPALA
jgi:hypothetical protein